MHACEGTYSRTACVHAPGLINHYFYSSGTSTYTFNKELASPLQLKDTTVAQMLDNAPTELLYTMNEAPWVCVRPCEYMQIRAPVSVPSNSACLQY